MSDQKDASRKLAAAPGTIAGLLLAVRERVGAVASRFATLESNKGPRAPRVIDGWMPPRKSGDYDLDWFPLLIVRPKSGSDSEQSADQNARAVIEIIVGTTSDTDDGWVDVAMVIDALRADFGEQPAIKGTAFEQVGPMTWEIPVEQPRPQWFGTVTTNWSLPRPQRVEALNP